MDEANSNSCCEPSFEKRSKQWERQRANWWYEQRQRRDALEADECSFHPTLSHSHSARGLRTHGAADWVPRSRLCAAPPPSSSCLALRRWQEDREEELRRECTFTPNLSKSSSSFRRQNLSRASSREAISSGNKAAPSPFGASPRSCSAEPECSTGAAVASPLRSYSATPRKETAADELLLAPRTNAVPSHMVNARMYLRKDVFARLTQPQQDMWTPMTSVDAASSLGGSPEESPQPVVQGSQGGSPIPTNRMSPSPGSPTRSTPGPSPSSRSIGEAHWHFLERQNTHWEDRCRRLNELTLNTAPPLQPALCERSMRLAEAGRKKRQSNSGSSPKPQRVLASADEMEECSFRPTINASSACRAARSSTELSVGDLEKRTLLAAEIRKALRAEEEEELTFAPRFVSVPPKGVSQGRLRILEDPKAYISRVATARSGKLAKQQKELQKRSAQEVEACTFHPKTLGPAPAFVQHMAETHRSARNAKEKENQLLLSSRSQLHRPDWR
eukprot:gnl/TRDRNA2_/TRDRNA2_83186_c0_seq3.p1 gnl/TRDRNA2_/TRDRNA2_83186_c0~~gnl/TRDRNA2_/TRDRNA2_83186_c0_seq3.p1  ORF type:complete len:503 (+),score=72.53 gnl/TRDRNA2_/TRDRNA2_83186_c0_seq3:446-1954(+)